MVRQIVHQLLLGEEVIHQVEIILLLVVDGKTQQILVFLLLVVVVVIQHLVYKQQLVVD